jgi:ribosomal protein uL13
MKSKQDSQKIIIDGENAIFGRLCAFVAKKALEGNEIIILNSEKTIITGRKEATIKKYKTLRAKGGSAQKGPNYSKMPYKMLKRGIRGMLPNHRWGIGKQALENIKCYEGVPKEFENIERISMPKIPSGKSIKLKELSRIL